MNSSLPPILFTAKPEPTREPARSVLQVKFDRRNSGKHSVELSPQKKIARASGFNPPHLLGQGHFEPRHPLHFQTLSAKRLRQRLPR
jgi:hypothetical protein